MMNQTSPARIRQDCRQISQTLLKMAFPRVIIRVVVLTIAALVWLLVSNWLLETGKSASYEFLRPMGQPAIDALNRVNPYLWWVVVASWSLIVFWLARAWVNASIRASRASPVPTRHLSSLVNALSDEVIDVLRWAWGDRANPFTLGDLRQALIELRHGRIDKIAMVQEQAGILDARPSSGRDNDRPRDSARRDRYAEPRLDSLR